MDQYKIIQVWAAAVMLCLISSLVFLHVGMSYFPFVWMAVIVIIAYKAKKQPAQGLSLRMKSLWALFGVVLCSMALSLPEFRMPEITLILSGLSVILFALLDYRSLIIPAAIPATVSLGSRFIRPMLEELITPLVQLTFIIVSSIFGLFVPIQIHGVIISFAAVNGAVMNIGIDNSCSGIWSLGAFTLAMMLVLIIFPHITGKWLKYFGVGFAVTYALNILRILLVCAVGYYTGNYDTVMFAHTHIGWILFTIWMIVFWYFFIFNFMKDKKTQA